MLCRLCMCHSVTHGEQTYRPLLPPWGLMIELKCTGRTQKVLLLLLDKFLMTFLNYMQHLIKIKRQALKMLRQEYFQV